jgi:MFS family permease
MADIIGRRITFLVGCGLYSAFTLGCGLSKTTAVGIISTTFPIGQRRNIAFTSVGAGSPAGYTVGLVLGGVFVGTIGWRCAYYLTAIVNVMLLASAI